MKQLLILFLLISFILWVLPLGVFIKPSLQKLACDGQRAICMCHAMLPKASAKAMDAGSSLKAGAVPAKENSSAGNYFVEAKHIVVLNLFPPSILENQIFCYKNPFLGSIDYIPKF